MTARIAILTGYGINSDIELAHSFNLAGGQAERVHLPDAIDGRTRFEDFDILAMPGGFSFGDHIASGRVFANRLRHKLGDTLLRLREQKKPIIGICNGFQVLVKLGLLPGTEPASFTQTCTLTYNDSSRFENRWCYLDRIRIGLEADQPMAQRCRSDLSARSPRRRQVHSRQRSAPQGARSQWPDLLALLQRGRNRADRFPREPQWLHRPYCGPL